jgi:large subunit ribosomal protein L4
MAEVDVKNLKNQLIDRLTLADEVFNYEASETLVWEAVNAYLASQRKGTHATRNRAAVSGSGRKLWRQKGTGRARVGSIRSPLWRKGGTVFGPSPRDYSMDFPKKKRRGAIRMVLTDKLKNARLVVVDGLELDSHRTKDFLGVLSTLELNSKVLVVDDRENRNLFLSTRNLPTVKMVPTGGVNVYDLLNHDHLLISKRSILELQEVLQR